jgi:tight adherence protein C
MIPFSLNDLPDATHLFVVVAAVALTLGGVTLIRLESRYRGEALARRVKSVQETNGASADQQDDKIAGGASFTHAKAGPLTERDRREIVRRARKFGVQEKYASACFIGVRLSVTLGVGFLSLLLLPYFSIFAGSRPITVITAAGLGAAGWFLPRIFVRMWAKNYETAVVSGLPDALELLVICVEAGISLEDGLGRIASEIQRSRPELADELALTLADLKILTGRERAFANLAVRIDAPIVRSVVTTLTQTMRYGTPLAQALRVVATEMRNDSLIAMEGRANRLPALLTVPMILFIMPTIFLIVGGPAALRVIDTFLK